ncbi:Major Facilitator Superfamily protein [Octadecabacter temperatus]|uniref:Major Facilitator Superfamily protein n=1 Tax=Octadecabacter temperatus TaxID=1458307 RepID=A0A0K0Y795_9RHOB|nr:MFS transporter [Octadecabacter temperatus]AKS46795.1 Major Facilitator Superfamily protein [Octadecabacter temperatus]SIO21371.1 Major Facilitator Superfamily protein [Octadecabacter temperatus]
MNPDVTSNISLYRWSRFLRSLTFWQAVWFLYFQDILSGAQAILLYVVLDVAVTTLEVPSGYMSDRLGRRKTLIASAIVTLIGVTLLGFGSSFATFAAAQILIGAGSAFSSGTDEAMLYESLAATGREDEIEAQEVIAWRYSFIGLALSAVTGGALALLDPRLPFIATGVAMAGLLWVTWRFVEPPRTTDMAEGSELLRLSHLGSNFRNPVLLWFFALTVLMYCFSHLPFVFGQPFILEALNDVGLASSAPLVSGLITALMMGISVAVSLFALQLRNRLGLPLLLLGAFGLQIAISGVMALTESAVVLVFLLLRMVPDALSRPFILGRIQPLLSDDSRATWLSLKSFVGRLVFAVALSAGAVSTTDAGLMPYADIARILTIATLIGMVAIALLALSSRRIAVAAPKVSDC